MPERFVVTGSGRSGTKWLAAALTEAGATCGHEMVYGLRDVGWGERWAESSWMAACHLPVEYPVVLLARHPMGVVRSLMEIGFFGWQQRPGPNHNQCHEVLREWAPDLYDRPGEADRCLDMWWRLTAAALAHAEVILKIETLGTAQLARLLRWAGHDDAQAHLGAAVPPLNQFETLRARTKVRHSSRWDIHDPELATWARALAETLGYADA